MENTNENYYVYLEWWNGSRYVEVSEESERKYFNDLKKALDCVEELNSNIPEDKDYHWNVWK